MGKMRETADGDLFFRLGSVFAECKKEYEALRDAPVSDFTFSVTDDFTFSAAADAESQSAEKHDWTDRTENLLLRGDNLEVMRWLLSHRKMGGSLRLIYIDPPFCSGADYQAALSMGEKTKTRVRQKAYADTWNEGLEEYLRMLTLRLFFMKDLLAEDGVIWVHLDWHAAHYVKLIMDTLFGQEHFINEVIWHYKSGGASPRYFARKHDTLLFYAKGENYYFAPQKEKSYNRGYKPYRFQGVEEYEDELGWYTMVNRRDVWQLDMVGRTSSERTGYATQKPEALLDIILESCTREGDLCADFFSGSGTLAVTAGKRNRRFVCCDASKLAVSATTGRLAGAGIPFLRGELLRDQIRAARTTRIGSRRIRMEAEKHFSEIHLVLKRCGLPGKEADLSPARRTELKKLVQKEPLSLVRFWAVDPEFDGRVFRPRYLFCRDKTAGLAAECVFPLPAQSAGKEFRDKHEQPACPVAVKVCDVFGEEIMLVLDSFL